MSVYKPFTTADLIVTPFEVNKSFSFDGNELTLSNIGIERYIGKNIQDSVWISGSNNTGQSILTNKQLVYDSIKQLYYSNYLLSSSGSPASTASFTSRRSLTSSTADSAGLTTRVSVHASLAG